MLSPRFEDRIPVRVVGALISLLLLAACGEDEEGDQGGGELDLETLQAETEHGTMQAEALPNVFEGEVDDDLFVGISMQEPDEDGAQTLTAYLCDGDEVSVWLQGEMAEDDLTRLGGFEDGAHLEFGHDPDRDIALGRVVVVGHGSGGFEAIPASGDAGLYRAEEETEEGDVIGGWVVLADNRQRGAVERRICITLPGGIRVCAIF
jgi:hypothetical protein